MFRQSIEPDIERLRRDFNIKEEVSITRVADFGLLKEVWNEMRQGGPNSEFF